MPAPRKTSLAQIIELLVYLENHRDIQLGTAIPKGLGTREKGHWQNIAKILNKLPGGEIKTATQWKKYWNELKWRCRKKVNEGRRPLVPFEKRILNLAGGVKKYPIYVLPTEGLIIKPKENNLEEELDDNIDAGMDFKDNSRLPETRDEDCITPDPMPTVDIAVETCHSDQEEVERKEEKHSLNEDVPEWVRNVEHSRLGLEERTTRAIEQMSTGITSIAEAMHSIVGSLQSIEASIRNLINKS